MARGFGATFGVGGDAVATAPGIPAVNVRTISVWFNRNGSGFAQPVRGKSGTTDAQFLLYHSSNAKLELYRCRATTNEEWGFPAEGNVANQLLHVIACYDASTSTTPIAYVNGRAATLTNVVAGSGAYVAAADNFTLGSSWDGLIGDFAAWNGVALTAREAMALYQGADPRDIRGRSLVEFISMRSGAPRSMVRGAQPVTTGTRLWKDRLDPPPALSVPLFALASAPPLTPIGGTLAATLGAVTSAATAALALSGIGLATFAPVTGTAAATVTIKAQAGTALSPLTSSAAGALRLSGVVVATLDALTGSGSAVVVTGRVGQTSATLAGLTATATATLRISAQANVTLGAVTGLGVAQIVLVVWKAAPEIRRAFSGPNGSRLALASPGGDMVARTAFAE